MNTKDHNFLIIKNKIKMYKLKEGVEMPKEFKIKVNPEQSKALQEHLFSIGINWCGRNELKCLERPYLYVSNKYRLEHGFQESVFNATPLKQIEFIEYFEQVKHYPIFPEKWCIKVTKENCQELDNYLHANSKNYEEYEKDWGVCIPSLSDLYFHSTCVGYHKYHLHNLKCEGYEEITTEQFREHFGVKEIKQMPLDKKVNDWKMSDQAQIVFNILYKKGIKFDNNDFEVYLRIFEEGVNFEQQKNK